jgi:hypothetical protein
MKRRNEIVLAVLILTLTMLACNAIMGGGGGEDPTGATSTPSPRVILSDDFSSTSWGTGTDADSSVEYANSALQFIVYTPSYFVWSTPNDENYQNIHMEVTAINNGTDTGTSFGLMCDQQVEADNSFYYFAISPTGEYAIVKATAGESDVVLTNNAQWGASDLIAQNAASYRIGADCGNGTLTLYVDGRQVDSVADASYVSGGIALFVSSGSEIVSTDISFDDFLMTELP